MNCMFPNSHACLLYRIVINGGKTNFICTNKTNLYVHCLCLNIKTDSQISSGIVLGRYAECCCWICLPQQEAFDFYLFLVYAALLWF